jgi:hypothetical protein
MAPSLRLGVINGGSSTLDAERTRLFFTGRSPNRFSQKQPEQAIRAGALFPPFDTAGIHADIGSSSDGNDASARHQ